MLIMGNISEFKGVRGLIERGRIVLWKVIIPEEMNEEEEEEIE